MWLRKILFLDAIAFNSARASASVTGAGRSMAVPRAMLRGTMPSMRARREAAPTVLSMWASSSGPMPMWRARNSAGFSSSARGRADCISMGKLGVRRLGSGVLGEVGVGGLVHQAVELGRVGQLHLEEPAAGQRVAVGQRGVVAQGFVDFDD